MTPTDIIYVVSVFPFPIYFYDFFQTLTFSLKNKALGNSMYQQVFFLNKWYLWKVYVRKISDIILISFQIYWPQIEIFLTK
jgi:hypothetical protein